MIEGMAQAAETDFNDAVEPLKSALADAAQALDAVALTFCSRGMDRMGALVKIDADKAHKALTNFSNIHGK